MTRTHIMVGLLFLVGATSTHAEKPTPDEVALIIDRSRPGVPSSPVVSRGFLTTHAPSFETKHPGPGGIFVHGDNHGPTQAATRRALEANPEHAGLVHTYSSQSEHMTTTTTMLGQRRPFSSPQLAARVEVAANLPVGTEIQVQAARAQAMAIRQLRAHPEAAAATDAPVVQVTHHDPNVPHGMAFLHATTPLADARYASGIHVRSVVQRSGKFVARRKSVR